MRSLVLALVAALLAAGCMGSSPPTAETASSDLEPSVVIDPDEIAADPALLTSQAPIWLLGDAWSITTHGDGEEQATLVVTQASADAYTLATTSESMAGWDAMIDVSYLGRIRAADLAGFQQDQPVQYYSFPLEDGKSWTTQWDGLEITLTAKKGARGFDIVGTTPEGAEHVKYDFVPELKWWSHIEFTEGYGFRVDRFTSGWKGELASATSKIVYESASAAPVANPAAGMFSISEGQSFAMLMIAGGGERWARTLTITQPDGTPYMTTTPNFEAELVGGRYFATERLPATAGEWRISAPTAHDPEGWGSVTVYEVAIAKLAFAP